MKTYFISFAVLCLMTQNTEAITQLKKFKIGDDSIEFDEEAEFKEAPKKVVVSLEQLASADTQLLGDFDKVLDSAKRNAGKGELNIEMGRAQAQQCFETLKSVHHNIKEEKSKLTPENNRTKTLEFYKKISNVQKKVPEVEEVYKLLEMGSDNKDEFSTMSKDFDKLMQDAPSLAEL